MTNKLYEEENVKAIANALRLKNNSSTTYKISEMENGVLCLPFSNIPTYHYEEAVRVANILLNLRKQHPNCLIFGTISDNHPTLTAETSLTSAKHAVFALEMVGHMACDFIANLGDNLQGTEIDSASNLEDFQFMEKISRYMITSQDSFNLVGNHEKCSSTQTLYDYIGKYNNFDVSATTQIRGFGYKDYEDKKVRVIALNTCDYWNITGGNGMSYEQKDFLMKALDLSSKSDYSSWTIIILSHIPIDFAGGDYNKGTDLKAILKAYDTGGTVTITVNSSYANSENESDKYSGTLTYNYAEKNAPKVINIHGHIHTNAYGKLRFLDDGVEFDKIFRMATMNSAFTQNKQTSYENAGYYSITATEYNKLAKSSGSAKDTSATFYFMDLDNKKIYSIGYGACTDRTLIYADGAIFTITYSLTDVVLSNTVTSAIEGEKYTTTLSIGEGYELDTVKVIMGGIDITSSAYANGIITITEVTGDIIITAKAKDNYIPHWDLADRIAVTNVYEEAGKSHACVTSRHNYIYGIASTGIIDYRTISNVSLNGNDITFTSSQANYNIGLPYQLEAGAGYNFSATASQSARLRVVTFDTTGKFVSNSEIYSSSGTALTLDFTASSESGYWTVLMLDVKTSGNTTTFSNITLTKTSEGTGGDEGGETPDTPVVTVNNLFSSTDADFVDGQILRSSGETKGGTGFVTGYIEATTDDTIYVRNEGGTSYNDQGAPIICLYNSSDKSFNTGFYSSQTGYVTIDADGLGFSCKIQKSGIGFVRIQGQPTGGYSNFIVTKNEPII